VAKGTVKLKNVGEDYSGYDDGEAITIAAGEIGEVSAEKAEQLQADFPDWFSTKSGAKAKDVEPTQPPAPLTAPDRPAPASDERPGARASRDEIDAWAVAQGVADAADLDTKADVFAAVDAL
jgi:hypothetical protein